MSFSIKYIIPFLAVLGSGSSLSAQEVSAVDTAGEIVMTKSELDAFLAKIIALRKKQLANQKGTININQSKIGSSTNATLVGSDQQILRELERTNARIDMMLINLANGNRGAGNINQSIPNSNVAQPYYQPNTPPVQYYQNAPAQPAPQVSQQPVIIYDRRSEEKVNTNYSGKFVDTQAVSNMLEIERMQQQIGDLEQELKLMKALNDESKEQKYKDDISNLDATIVALKSDLAIKNRPTVIPELPVVEQPKMDDNSELLNSLKSERENIYFPNNSYALSSSDYARLQEVVNTVKQNPGHVTVMLQGFASSVGNAQYNDRLSFNRAETVKKWLLAHGLVARDVVTLHHGVDQGVDAAQARRVEITYIVR